jgi:hypothetical protein
MLQGVDRQFVAHRQEKSRNAVRSARTWTCILRMGTTIQNISGLPQGPVSLSMAG